MELRLSDVVGALSHALDVTHGRPGEGFGWLPIGAAHARGVRDLATHHRDPFDRLLVAQALIERLPVVTTDARLADYGVEVRG
jgi:PIN domain nuclease of toxin-antitoxin system